MVSEKGFQYFLTGSKTMAIQHRLLSLVKEE